MASFMACAWLLVLLHGAAAAQMPNGDHFYQQLDEYFENMKAEIESKYDARILALEQKFEDEISSLKRDFSLRENAYKTEIEKLQEKARVHNYGTDGEEQNVELTDGDDQATMKEKQSDDNLVDGTAKESHKVEDENQISNVVKVEKRQYEVDGPRVAFFASLTNNQNHMGVNQDIPFDKVLTNIGAGFNGHHGTFVAPVAGTYVLFTTIRGANDWGHFMVNGNVVAKLDIGASGQSSQSSQMVIVHLNINDDVAIQGTDLDAYITGDRYSTFCGFLLYADDVGTASAIVG